jgi:hypothetical protein
VSKLGVYQRVAALVGQPRILSDTDEQEIVYVLNDVYGGAIDYVLVQVPWRFALTEAVMPQELTGLIPGYAYKRAIPADALRLVSIGTSAAAPPRQGDLPVDVRLFQGVLYWNCAQPVRITYIDIAGRIEAVWPVEFEETLAAYLAFLVTQRISSLNGRTDDLFGLFQRALASAAERQATSESPWLQRQLDGSFMASVRYVLSQGAWHFATKVAAIGTAGAGVTLAQRFAKPADHLKTISLFVRVGDREVPVDAREQADGYEAAIAPILVRYVSADTLNTPSAWPDQFLRTVGAHLGIDWGDMATVGEGARPPIWPDYLKRALEENASQPDRWLPFQLDGSFGRASDALLQQAYWRFALTTVGVAPDTPIDGGYVGYANSFTIPADHVRTRSINLPANARPIDAREVGGKWAANITTSIAVEYVSRTRGENVLLWPAAYVELLWAYLTRAEGWTDMLQVVAAQLAVPENPWLQHQLSGMFARAAGFILEQGMWNFALRSATLNPSGTPLPGFANHFNKPAPHVTTQAVFLIDGAREVPVDVREHETGFSSDAEAISIRYIAYTALDNPGTWPETFLRCVGAHLGIDTSIAWPEYLGQAIISHGTKPDRWLPYQRDGSLARTAEALLQRAFWRFAQKVTTITSPYDLPNDHIRTRAVYVGDNIPVDAQEMNTGWKTAVTQFRVDYTSKTLGVDPTRWPPAYIDLIWAFLTEAEGRWETLNRLSEELAVEVSPWLKFQNDGTFITGIRTLIWEQDWKFATKTTTLNDDNDKPADWAATVRIYDADDRDVAFRDRNDHFVFYDEEDYRAPFKIDYVDLDVITDPTQWTGYFENALLAWLGYRDVVGDPNASGAAMQARKVVADDALKGAKKRDDMRERPRITSEPGRFVSARGGWSSWRRENG